MPVLAVNKKATFDYQLLENYTAGLVLTGAEVKAAKSGQISLKGAYVVPKAIKGRLPEFYLINSVISAYKFAPLEGYKVDRARKLLLTKKEIKYLMGKAEEKGLSLVPTKVYTAHNLIKLDFAVARGKKKYDKREDIKRKDNEREMKRAMKR